MRETFMLPRLCEDNGALATGVAKQGASSWLWYPLQRHLQACVHSPTVYLPKSWQKDCKIPTKRSSPALGRGQLTVPVFIHPATGNFPPFTNGSFFDWQFLVSMPRPLTDAYWSVVASVACVPVFFFLGFYLKAYGFLKESISPIPGAI